MEKQTDKPTGQIDRQTDGQQTDKQRDIQAGRQKDYQTDRQKVLKIDKSQVRISTQDLPE